MLKVIKTVLGAYGTNTYVLIDEASGEAAVIDPAVRSRELEELLFSNGVKNLKYILLTHGHFDHITGVYSLKQRFGGEVLIHEEDALCLQNAEMSLSTAVDGYPQTEMEADSLLHDGDEIMLGENKISVKHTPGHTKGSVIFITEFCIFSGDTLFRCSMGRTDLPGGSTRTLFKSLREIGQLQGEYQIFTGHGEDTSLSYEKRNNRYLRANDFTHN